MHTTIFYFYYSSCNASLGMVLLAWYTGIHVASRIMSNIKDKESSVTADTWGTVRRNQKSVSD